MTAQAPAVDPEELAQKILGILLLRTVDVEWGELLRLGRHARTIRKVLIGDDSVERDDALPTWMARTERRIEEIGAQVAVLHRAHEDNEAVEERELREAVKRALTQTGAHPKVDP